MIGESILLPLPFGKGWEEWKTRGINGGIG